MRVMKSGDVLELNNYRAARIRMHVLPILLAACLGSFHPRLLHYWEKRWRRLTITVSVIRLFDLYCYFMHIKFPNNLKISLNSSKLGRYIKLSPVPDFYDLYICVSIIIFQLHFCHYPSQKPQKASIKFSYDIYFQYPGSFRSQFSSFSPFILGNKRKAPL